MAIDDISRSAFYFEKDYADLGMQQGRVLTDDDYNEGRRIARELQRRTGVDLIGAYGSPGEGFYIENAKVDIQNEIDFEIHDGVFYIGGLRLVFSNKETFKLQKNWLQYTKATASDNNTHLVYLEVWQQAVSAVEDSELFEVALGGPDTSTRLRTMWRVKLHKVTNTQNNDCTKAWGELVATWKKTAGDLTTGNELVPDTTLTVTFDSTGAQKDLCKSTVTGGYLGAENQAIRVQIVDDTHFTWGFDNGSPLYRVRVKTDKNKKGTVVEMLTEPKDEAHWPQASQIVEFLPWSAVLVNGEKLAEESKPGHFAKAQSAYDPDNKMFSLTSALPAGYGEAWKDRSDKDSLLENPFNKKEELNEYLFMRVWDRGDDLTSEPKILITNKAKLGTTGLQVTFNNNDRRPGDYWVIAARPETPKKVVPWQLEAQRPADGIRHFYAPLAIIEWKKANGSQLTGKVQDCRKTFRPLTEIQTCCTRTVGDGTHSHGDFSDIQKAIDSLPAGGGEICVLPGDYTHGETVILKDLNNVTIRGCGVRSKLLTPKKDVPLIQIEDCGHIKIASLSIEANTGIGIELKCKPANEIDQKKTKLKHIVLENLHIKARDYAAVVCFNGSFITLQGNSICLAPLASNLGVDKKIGRQPAVFLQGDDLLCEGNKIIVDFGLRSPKTALGGLQIGGGSARVEIRRNKIEGGNGNGITLGSVKYVKETSDAQVSGNWFELSWPYSLWLDPNGCIQIVPASMPPKGPDGVQIVPKSDGDLTEVRIIDNVITEMGTNGIAVAHFFDVSKTSTNKGLIRVDRLTIEMNHIHKCHKLALKQQIPLELFESMGYGGIALAGGEYIVIRNNRIEKNGTKLTDPTCGVFIYSGEGIAVEGNRILHNGIRAAAGNTLRQGQSGGIVIPSARTRNESIATGDPETPRTARQDGVPAARIHGNVVVAPECRALKLIAVGPVSIQGNQFTTQTSQPLPGIAPQNSVSAIIDGLGGAVVAAVNMGVSNELDFQLGRIPSSSNDKGKAPRPHSASGNVLFNDNQVVFDALHQGVSFSLSSVLLVSFDDISMTGNQCDCDLVSDSVVANALVIAPSLRVADNRFKEGRGKARFSALTLGYLNSITDNQGTHCFSAKTLGPKHLTVVKHNRSVVEWNDENYCKYADD